MKNIDKNFKNLRLLGLCKPKLRKKIIENGDKELVLALNECIQNFLMGNIKLDEDSMNKIKKYKKVIRNFSNLDCQKKKKKFLFKNDDFYHF